MLQNNDGSAILETGILRINLEWIKKYLGFLCILYQRGLALDPNTKYSLSLRLDSNWKYIPER